MADGYFNHDTYTLGLEISSKDLLHLKKLAKILKVKIHTRTKNLKYKGNIKQFTMVSINKTDQILIKEFIEKFDIKPNKTINPPTNINFKNDNLFLAFLIGFIDGDGSITKLSGKYNKGYRCTLECHKNWLLFLIWITDKFYDILDLNIRRGKVYISNRGSALTAICKTSTLIFLKNKVKELKLPVLKRKWSKIKFSQSIRGNYAR